MFDIIQDQQQILVKLTGTRMKLKSKPIPVLSIIDGTGNGQSTDNN